MRLVVSDGRSGPASAETPGPADARRDRLAGCGALMLAAQRGDKRAYAELLATCQDWLRTYLARRIAPNLVEEVSQEILLAVHLKRHTYEAARPFAPWFVGIARYKWIDRLRTLYREPGRDELAEDTGQTPSHEATVLSGILLERLMAHLPPAQAKAIRLVKIEGLSIEEASLRSGQSASLVKVNIHRGRKAMMAKLEQAHE